MKKLIDGEQCKYLRKTHGKAWYCKKFDLLFYTHPKEFCTKCPYWES
ncbi:MAG: hypothetical protein ACTSUO_00835 [Candidatus Thorarchaeota archaeon]